VLTTNYARARRAVKFEGAGSAAWWFGVRAAALLQ
jgi:hypothetical protein